MNKYKEQMDEQRRKTKRTLHSVYDYVMGALWLCMGGFVLLHKSFGLSLEGFDPTLITIFGVAAAMYGAFRLYRGYKKNY